MRGRVWRFLKVPANLAVIVAIAGGIWAVFTSFAEKNEKGSTAPSVKADHGGVVAGRDINAPVTINPDATVVVAPINERLEKLAAQVAREKGVEIAPLRSVLGKVDEKSVREEDIPKRLDAAADELIKLRAEIEQFGHGPPALASIAQEAQALIDKGDLDGARRALVRGREAARAQRSGATRAATRQGSWRWRRGSTICSSPTAPPPRNMPKRPVSSRLST